MNDLNGKKKIFLIGIGGIGMSALAVILNKRGFEVLGSDRSNSKTVEILKEIGIKVFIGHESDNITKDIDLVVYTNAISDDNPEYLKAKELKIPVMERAKMLNILASGKFAIGISGTHGKTTTTSMIAKIFLNASKDPTLAVGGHLNEINGSGYEGSGKYFIYEACEAFGSFLKLFPEIAVVTNIDDDHLDYYKKFSNVKKAFYQYLKDNVPIYGTIIYNSDDKPLNSVVKKIKNKRKISVGIKNKKADFVAKDIVLDEFSSNFTVCRKGKIVGRFFLNIPGIHNVYNALLAIATANANGIEYEDVYRTLANFKNADRRFQIKSKSEDLTVIDDYAHHPSEILATLSAAKNLSMKKNAILIAIFQPHLYSRTELLYKEFARSLSIADKVVLTEIYAAREKNEHNITTKIVYDEIIKIKGKENVFYTESLENIPDTLKPLLLNKKNVVVTLGAGDVWKISEKLAGNL
ncbi:MAG: UDP-N-acetylmuramate--L-alanine ligase [Brevinematales bacterium]